MTFYKTVEFVKNNLDYGFSIKGLEITPGLVYWNNRTCKESNVKNKPAQSYYALDRRYNLQADIYFSTMFRIAKLIKFQARTLPI